MSNNSSKSKYCKSHWWYLTYRGEFLDFLIGSAQRGQSDFLGELGEAGISQEGHVSQELVDAVPAEEGKEQENRLLSNPL